MAQLPVSNLIGATRSDLGIGLAVVLIIAVMMIPVPSFVLDLLIATNVTISIVLLLLSLYIIEPVEFSIFPTVLLLVTLYRLALNVASTRLILLDGSQGVSAAGAVIESFGQFVVGGNYVVGCVVFLVLLAIQFIVINHGAVRISEVTARFTLDAMPGKQMSIDADLNAGLIGEEQARERRTKVSREAEFYGAMDGAVRFTKRDSIASMIIVVINIIAGFLIGVVTHGLPLMSALKTYTILTIGDGLVSAIPALLISVTGGIMTTRAASHAALGEEVSNQVFSDPKPLVIGAGVLMLVAIVPGLPFVTFFIMSMVMAGLGGVIIKRRRAQAQLVEQVEEPGKKRGRNALNDSSRLILLAWSWATNSFTLLRTNPGEISCPMSNRFDASWRLNWESSFRPFTSPTTSNSNPGSIAFC